MSLNPPEFQSGAEDDSALRNQLPEPPRDDLLVTDAASVMATRIRNRRLLDGACLIALAGLYLATSLARFDVPGAYMDAVNPDYLVARSLADGRDSLPAWVVPGNLLLDRFPILIQVYHGALPFYLNAPIYLALGTDIGGIRVANAFMGFIVLASLFIFLRAFKVPVLIALVVTGVLAVDPAFTFSYRTQFGITMIPLALLLLGAASARSTRTMSTRRVFLSGMAVGLAIYGYFIYAILAIPVLVWSYLSLGRQPRPGRVRLLWVSGVALGASGYLFGLILGAIDAGGVGAFWAQLTSTVSGLEPNSSSLGLSERVELFGNLGRLAVEPTANQLMMLGQPTDLALPWLRIALPAAAGLVAATVLWRDRVAGRVYGPGSASGIILGVVAAYALLVLVFGDRLWAHHLSGLVVLGYALLALAASGLGRSLIPLVVGVGLTLTLLACNVVDRSSTLDALTTTGGVGLSSDAITRFSETVDEMEGPVTAFTPDWGVMMPFVMMTGGDVPTLTDFSADAARSALCAGSDVVVALMTSEGMTRPARWSKELAWGSRTWTRSFNATVVLSWSH